MNQDVTVQKLLNSISIQLGGLSVRQVEVIGNSLYCAYGVGYDSANKLKSWIKPVVRIDAKGNRRSFNSITDAAKATCIDRWAIIQVLKGKYKQWKGYKFEYEQTR